MASGCALGVSFRSRTAMRVGTVRNGTAVTLVLLLGVILLAAVVQLLRAGA